MQLKQILLNQKTLLQHVMMCSHAGHPGKSLANTPNSTSVLWEDTILLHNKRKQAIKAGLQLRQQNMPLPLKQNNFNGKIGIWKLDNCYPGSNMKIKAVDAGTRNTAFLEPAASSDRARELTLPADGKSPTQLLKEPRSSLKNEELLQKVDISMYLSLIKSQHPTQLKLQEHQNTDSEFIPKDLYMLNCFLKASSSPQIRKDEGM